jgi:hypothetical protein
MSGGKRGGKKKRKEKKKEKRKKKKEKKSSVWKEWYLYCFPFCSAGSFR